MTVKGGKGVRSGWLILGGHFSYIFNFKCKEVYHGKRWIKKDEN
jgi:hypothetical protein